MARATGQSSGIQPVRRQRRWWNGATLVSGALFAACVVFAPPWAPLTGLLFLCMLAGHATIHRNPGRRAMRAAPWTLEEDGVLVVEGKTKEHRYHREDIARGWLENDGATALLETEDETLIALGCETPELARQVLREVGVPDQRAEALSVRRASSEVGLIVGCLGLFLGLSAVASLVASVLLALVSSPGNAVVPLIMGLTFLALAMRYVLGVLPATVIAGSDGVHLRRPLRRDLFIDFDSIEQMGEKKGRVHLTYAEKDNPRKKRKTSFFGSGEILDLIRRAIDRRDVIATGHDLAELDRRGRALSDWEEALAVVCDAQGDYRQLAVDHRTLLEVVEDPLARVERRIGAARALAGFDDDGVHDRVRIAAEACAQPALRIAIERAVEGELEARATEEALAAERTA